MKYEEYRQLAIDIASKFLIQEFDRTKKTGLEGRIVKQSLLHGKAGVALFLENMYQGTGTTAYQQRSVGLFHDLCGEFGKEDVHNFGFLEGRLGFLYALFECSKEVRDEFNIKELMRSWKNPLMRYMTSEFIDDSLINGRSGALLVLMKVYQTFPKQEIFELIREGIAMVIRRGFSKNGRTYWNRSALTINGLTGFASGGSGIGFVLNEAANLFSHPSLLEVSRQAFAFEDDYWDAASSTWAALSVDTGCEFDELRMAYSRGQTSIFEPRLGDYEWENGAVGMILARGRAAELTADNYYNGFIISVLNKISWGAISSARSLSAILAFLHHASDILGPQITRRTLEKVKLQADRLLKNAFAGHREGELLALGVLCLNLWRGYNSWSPLFPILSQNGTKQRVRMLEIVPAIEILHGTFPRTMTKLKDYSPVYAESVSSAFKAPDDFVRSIESIDSMIGPQYDSVLRMAKLEFKKYELTSSLINNALLRQKEIHLRGNAMRMLESSDGRHLEREFVQSEGIFGSVSYLRPDEVITLTDVYEPLDLERRLKLYLKDTYLLLSSSEQTVALVKIDYCMAIIIHELRRPAVLQEVRNNLILFFESMNLSTKRMLLNDFIDDSFFNVFMRDRIDVAFNDCIGMGVIVEKKD